jgi:hypothetical protein
MAELIAEPWSPHYRPVTEPGKTGLMNLYTLILINATLGLLVVFGLLTLLGYGIRADRPEPTIEEQIESWRESERLAA